MAENVRLLVAKDGIGVTLVAPGLEAAPALTAEQVAETILFAINQPEGVDVNHLVVRSAWGARHSSAEADGLADAQLHTRPEQPLGRSPLVVRMR